MRILAAPPTRLQTHLLFGVYSLCLVALNARALRALIELSMHNATASHLVLVPFITAALICLERDSIFSSVRSFGALEIGVFVVVGALAWVGCLSWASPTAPDFLSATVGALVVLWAGGFLLFYGYAAFRAALFPLVFLAFMVPIPNALLAGATLGLRRGSTEVVAILFDLTGTPFHREGFVFTLPKFAVQIADECSGIRSSIALLLTILPAGHMFLKTGWKKALLVAIIVPLAIVKNSIRIVSLSILGTYVDTSFITGALHHEGGIVFFLIALALLSPIVVLLQKSETTKYLGAGSA